jgi:hypothetical protein
MAPKRFIGGEKEKLYIGRGVKPAKGEEKTLGCCFTPFEARAVMEEGSLPSDTVFVALAPV